ncbi:MAG: ATP-binding cassette domain-containing protein [Pseudomonadota bacterium]
MSEELVLNVSDLKFTYGDKQIVDISEFALKSGQSMAVIGPSGCGKTTFLHLLAGLLSPGAGTIQILGQELSQLSLSALDRFRGQNMGMVFQRLFLMPALTVRQNIELAQKMARVDVDVQAVDRLLTELGIQDLSDRKPKMLSQGQAQRVAIARALVHRPALVLADEPTSALDNDRAEDALSLLKHSAETAGASLVVVTHDERVRGKLDSEFEMEAIV